MTLPHSTTQAHNIPRIWKKAEIYLNVLFPVDNIGICEINITKERQKVIEKATPDILSSSGFKTFRLLVSSELT